MDQMNGPMNGPMDQTTSLAAGEIIIGSFRDGPARDTLGALLASTEPREVVVSRTRHPGALSRATLTVGPFGPLVHSFGPFIGPLVHIYLARLFARLQEALSTEVHNVVHTGHALAWW